jgi:hypothetical protein
MFFEMHREFGQVAKEFRAPPPAWQIPAPKRIIFVRRTPTVRPSLIAMLVVTILFALAV